MTRLRSESGQALVLSTLFVAALLGCAALVIDVGSWFRAQRDTQLIADAAALAGAQELPDDTGKAYALAQEYTTKNKGTSPQISFSSKAMPNDTIQVSVRTDAPGFFARVFSIDSVNVGAKAKARAGVPTSARYAAPIGVDKKHPLIAGCHPRPCFGKDTELDLEKTGPGAFRLINIDSSRGGTSPKILADWILRGYDGYMPLNWYFSDPGAKFNASEIQAALSTRIGDELLFPVYDDTRKGGANFEYEVIGWIGFVVTSFEARGSSGKLYGYFTRVVWEGILSESSPPGEDLGVRSVELIE